MSIRILLVIVYALIGVALGGYLEAQDARVLFLLKTKTIEIRIWFLLFLLLLLVGVTYFLLSIKQSLQGAADQVMQWHNAKKVARTHTTIAAIIAAHGCHDTPAQSKHYTKLIKQLATNDLLYAHIALQLIQLALQLDKRDVADKYFRTWYEEVPTTTQALHTTTLHALIAYYVRKWQHMPPLTATDETVDTLLTKLLGTATTPFATQQLVLLALAEQKVACLLPKIATLLDSTTLIIDEQTKKALRDALPNAWLKANEALFMGDDTTNAIEKAFAQLPKTLKQESHLLVTIASHWYAKQPQATDTICAWLYHSIRTEKPKPLVPLLTLYANIATTSTHLMQIQKVLKTTKEPLTKPLLKTLIRLSETLEFTKLRHNLIDVLNTL